MKVRDYKIVFRCDASIQIGTGHVMRCLTLADELSKQGAECSFICRQHDGNLIEEVQKYGYKVYPLPLEHDLGIESESKASLAHADWLASTQHRDAELSILIAKLLQPDWLIVDHYALDESWEKRLRQYCKKIMVIDDLADRFPDQMSGGQAQRVAIARSIVGPRQLLLADEPTGALDSTTSEAVMNIIRQRVDHGTGALIVTHEPRFAAYADRTIFLRDGQIIDTSSSCGPESLLTKQVAGQ